MWSIKAFQRWNRNLSRKEGISSIVARLQDSMPAIHSFVSLVFDSFPQQYLQLHHYSCKNDTWKEISSAPLIDSWSLLPVDKANTNTRRINFTSVTFTCVQASEPIPLCPLYKIPTANTKLQWIQAAWSIPDADTMEHLKCHYNWTETCW